ncbi:uncharacterized protein LOC121790278 [Salvia splendens]|uniref:uncharacterized protein LOC121790278 n=1 Tax=Salvia splendens TaxID=180675 RepID=UPI001C25909E|nr:uncharacterized protein LOC121790278 [Salvia splendens]
MVIVIRFVNKDGQIIERFLALAHVKKTTSVCLKEAIDSVFAKFKLPLSRLRGQGYDGASNMRGECNGLKALILKENPSAWADMIRKIEHDRLVEMIENGEIGTGRGQNQETSLKRPGDTRWGSHYVTVIRLANMWQSVTEIENVKESLRSFREFGWDTFLQEVNDFCGANDISITNMDDDAPKRISKRNGSNIKNYHHYRVGIFFQVVDLLTQEMENRFSEASTDLLSCMACLDQKNDFAAFNVHKLVHLATLYPKDFTSTQHTELFKQLETFVDVVRRDARLNGIEDLASLSQKIIETTKDKVFPLVYRLIELVLILPVATASVEKVSLAMKFVKTDLRNKMGDEWLNDSLFSSEFSFPFRR